jgi:hypothetical protein
VRLCKDPCVKSAREEAAENLGQGDGGRTLGGKSPREPPAVGGLITCPSQGTSARDKTQKLRPAGPAPRHPCGAFTGGRNSKWVRPGGNAPVTVSMENAPKGESHERCRRETKPARVRRAKTATRAIKP